ncbi:hypothetical protein TB1_032580 [Malus domestica]
MSSLLFHLYILLATLVLYNLYTHIAIFLLPVSSDFPTQTLGATPYQFLKFTQQWPKAVNESSQLANFTIHGLWPSNVTVRVLRCKGKKFNKSEMTSDLEQKLNTSWPNVLNGNNTWFWEHEYNHHGTCCEDTFEYNQTKYFELADEMWRNLNIAQMLNNSRIVPGKNYTTSDVMAAIEKETQHEPNIRCTNKTLREGVSKKKIIITLLEVVVCYDHDGKKMIHCPNNSTCGSQNQSIVYVK